MGWDDNGLPTERRVQNYYGVKCDLSVPYIENYKPPFEGNAGNLKPSDWQPISRQNFIELCIKLSSEDEVKFQELWTRLGVSVDWSLIYQTIDNRARATSQAHFLRNLARNEAYQALAPGLWDVTFQTAVAQAEVEAREYPGEYYKIVFTVADGVDSQNARGEQLYIDTTRPELLPSCVALIVHPDDERYNHLIGSDAFSPLFNVKVPIFAHRAAEIDKGTGIVMCCTFGDLTDVEWWREFGLDTRAILGKDGRITNNDCEWLENSPREARALFNEMKGKTVFTSRKILVDELRAHDLLIGEPQKTMRMASFYEKGDKPLEIVTSRQWYIKNGGKDDDLREKLLGAGEKLNFYPKFMQARYENWVNGLKSDWLVSRQRFFGVSFPIWYAVDSDGKVDYEQVIVPNESDLPIDPTIDVPNGFTSEQRNKSNGFTAENDIMDTWATSSLTPQIACKWLENERNNDETFNKTYPMDLRPQGQDIIRTWLFSTIVRSHLENDTLPWENAALSGWILDPDRKKMSKSKGNVVTPMHLLDEYSPDGVRYWAASAALGVDTAFELNQMKIGRRLAIKTLNIAKFVLSTIKTHGDLHEASVANVTNPLDVSMLLELKTVINKATNSLDEYKHSVALQVTEQFFWKFCDNYAELVKSRAYAGDKSAISALLTALDILLRLLAPYIPYTTEKARSFYSAEGDETVGNVSIHTAKFPCVGELEALNDDFAHEFDTACDILMAIRGVKSKEKTSMRTPIVAITIRTPKIDASVIDNVTEDLRSALMITGELEVVMPSGDDNSTEVTVIDYELGEKDGVQINSRN
jgi:valyl-tRNA synthetase